MGDVYASQMIQQAVGSIDDLIERSAWGRTRHTLATAYQLDSSGVMAAYSVYSLESAINEFFSQASTTREACDAKAKELVGGPIVPVEVQGVCSYSVYAGPDLQYVAQFRLKSLKLNPETSKLAREIYGPLVPEASYHGHLGDDSKEPLLIYIMDRIPGISHLDFILGKDDPDNSESNFVFRKTFMSDIAHFFALSWNAPQKVESDYLETLRCKYNEELQLLRRSLPNRFHHTIENCLDAVEDILSLPMVLLHRDFGTANVMVDGTSCHLTGVIDWAEAEICPFGQNLHALQAFTGALHRENGWRRYDDYEVLQRTFWEAFRSEAKDVTDDTTKTIRMARTMGLLLSHGFTKRFANMPQPVPIHDDETGRYNMLYLDGFLIDAETKFEMDLNYVAR